MTALVVAWVVFPLVLAALAVGCGLAVERVAGTRLPGALVPPLGLAAIIVVGALASLNGTTARLVVPTIVALAVAGFGLAFLEQRISLDPWAVAAACAVFAAYAAPIVLSGEATFAGYISLDDTATWLAITDRVMDHGRDLSGLAPSSYEAILKDYVGNGYPVGANQPLDIGTALVGQDPAWLFQPYLAFLAAMLALAMYGLLRRLIASSWLRAAVVFVAAQPALLYAYAFWSAYKEPAAAALIALAVALGINLTEQNLRGRITLPLATTTAALVAVLTLGGGLWIAPLLIAVAILVLRRQGLGRVAPAIGIFAALAVVLALPALATARDFARHTSSSSVLTSKNELGNLFRPLRSIQVFGIWPSPDFRIDPPDLTLTRVLIAVVALAGAGAVFWAARRRLWELPVYVGSVLLAGLALMSEGSPWVDGKSLATASPAFLFAGMAAAAILFQRDRRVEGAVLGLVIAAGVLWSNALTYDNVLLAPRSQLRELEHVGKRFAGEGPALMTENQIYGTRHFLRKLDPESPGTYRRRTIPLRDGGLVPNGEYADIDALQLGAILVYRTLVLPHSPFASRPPSAYALVWRGRFYEVWQRPQTQATRIIEHVSLGDSNDPAAVPNCADIHRLADVATRSGGRLVAVERPAPVVAPLGEQPLPAGWRTYDNHDVVYPSEPGSVDIGLRIPVTGVYGVWVGGSFRRQLEVLVDGRSRGVKRHQLSHTGVDTLFGDVHLPVGRHIVTLRYTNATGRPGAGGIPASYLGLGPVALSRTTAADTRLSYVDPASADALCGRRLDWVEAVAP